MQTRIAVAAGWCLAAMLSAPATAAPTCAQLASNPVHGLAGNPLVNHPLYPPPAATVVPANGPNKSYCQVVFTYSSRGGPAHGYDVGQVQHIGLSIGLPLNSADGGSGGIEGAWNGKIQNLGGGVCQGILGLTTAATNAGYVGSSTDTGHNPPEQGVPLLGCNFGVIQATHQLNLGMIEDFIYESLHQQVEWAKKLTAAYYGMAHKRNYWNGCSTGGRQGLALAQRYGDTIGIDGYIVGAPAIYWEEFRLAFGWAQIVIKDRLEAKGKKLSQGQINAVNAAATAACDVLGSDVVADGIIADPRQCKYDATRSICGQPGAPADPNCLDADQAAVMNMIWDGPRNRFGKRIWFPWERGITAYYNSAGAEKHGGLNFLSTSQVMNYNHKDLTFSDIYLYLDQDAITAAGNPVNAVTYVQEAVLASTVAGDYMETHDPDLNKVKRSGAKIIMWHGMQDPLIFWRNSMDYYRRVARVMGTGSATGLGGGSSKPGPDYSKLQSWFRYFTAPGVGHCGGGSGPDPSGGLLSALENWVERGIAPDTLLARGGSVPSRTRPLCPYPKMAIYNGSGSTDDAANFTCGGNLETKEVVCDSVRTPYKREDQDALDYAGAGVDPKLCAK